MLNRWTSTLRLTVESATTRPGFRSAAKLLSRERSEELPCLCSAQNPNMLVSLSVSRGVQAICAEGSTSANIDGDGDDREKARTADGGTFARLCVRGMRKVCRAQLEKILGRAKTKRHNVPDSRRALHMHVLERDFGIRAACMQQDCATCASMLRDAVTAAQSRFLATSRFSKKKCTTTAWDSEIESLTSLIKLHPNERRSAPCGPNRRCNAAASTGNFTNFEKVLSCTSVRS